MMNRDQPRPPPLTPAVFYILLALSSRERHGYEIMKQVVRDSARRVAMGPGTLYGSIKRMLADGLIEEAGERPDPAVDDERRRYYRLTERGRACLAAELQRYQDALDVAGRGNVVPRRLAPGPEAPA